MTSLIWSFIFRNLLKLSIRQFPSLCELRIVRMRITLLKRRYYQIGKQTKSFQFHLRLYIKVGWALKSSERQSKREIHSQNHEKHSFEFKLTYLILLNCYFICYQLMLLSKISSIFRLKYSNYFSSRIKFTVWNNEWSSCRHWNQSISNTILVPVLKVEVMYLCW